MVFPVSPVVFGKKLTGAAPTFRPAPNGCNGHIRVLWPRRDCLDHEAHVLGKFAGGAAWQRQLSILVKIVKDVVDSCLAHGGILKAGEAVPRQHPAEGQPFFCL